MVAFTLNGQPVSVEADGNTPLLWVIRDHVKLTGTMAFMFETRFPQRITRYAAESPVLDRDYRDLEGRWRLAIALPIEQRAPVIGDLERELRMSAIVDVERGAQVGSYSDRFGGVQTHVRAQAASLRARGHEVTVIAPSPMRSASGPWIVDATGYVTPSAKT